MSLKLAILDKKVIQAFANTQGDDNRPQYEAAQAVLSFLQAAMQTRKVADVINRYDLTIEELARIYYAAVTATLPNPLISSGAPMMSASLLFIEPVRLVEVVQIAERRQRETSNSELPRVEYLAEAAAAAAQAIKQVHDAHKAPPPLPAPGRPVTSGVGGGGCLGLVILAGVATVSASSVF